VDEDAEPLRSADPEAFGRFYARHLDAVTAYVARRVRVGSSSQAERRPSAVASSPRSTLGRERPAGQRGA